jgi:HK97 family phage portal protein
VRLGPFEVTRRKATDLVTHLPQNLQGPSRGGWWPVISEAFAGAWQRGVTINRQDVITYGAVWACVTLIAGDIAKLWLNLVEEDGNGICTVAENSAYSPVLRKPNHFSTRVKFLESWMLSKLTNGNTYVLKDRDLRGVVTALYVLDPSRVSVLVAPNGDVFYQLTTDYLSGIRDASVTVPAREIIHDLCVPLYHPLVGVSPIHACGLAAMQGLKIQQQSAKFFSKGLSASGVLTAPGTIGPDVAKRLEDYWNENFRGEENAGKIAVLGDGLKFERMMMTAVDAQLIDQLKWTSENVCACYHVPLYMVGIGPAPPYTDIQSINLQYYTQALQNPIENLETLLDEGLELKTPFHVEFDLDALLRMDGKTQMAVAKDGVSGGIYSPNEARARFNLKPAAGGDTPYLQQQMYSLKALAKRDAAAPAPATDAPSPTPQPPPLPTSDKPTKDDDVNLELVVVLIFKEIAELAESYAEPEVADAA